MVKKNKHSFLKVILFLIPLILAISILLYIRYVQTNNMESSEFFSPVDNRPLVISIVIFVSGYLLFLMLMFAEEIKGMFLRVVHHR